MNPPPPTGDVPPLTVAEQVERLRSDDEPTRHHAVTGLRELCLPKNAHCVENRQAVGDHGGIQLMVAMLESPNGDVQRSTCLALNETCLKNPVNSRTFQSCGAIPLVMRVLESGNPDLQTQALAVLGTSAVNAVEVRRGLKDAGAVPLLVSLLGSKTVGVQEWAAYALRKASSKASDLELGKAMIKEAVEAGADRMLVEMRNLRSRDAQEEAQQTLEYFEVDQEAVQSLMAQEAATKPLVALQRLCWMAVYHGRLGADSPARRLPLEIVELIAKQSPPYASEKVGLRWDAQGLAWVDSLNWQWQALQAEERSGNISSRLGELRSTVAELTKRELSLTAVEARVDRMEQALSLAEEAAARSAGVRPALHAMQSDVGGLLDALTGRLAAAGVAMSPPVVDRPVGGEAERRELPPRHPPSGPAHARPQTPPSLRPPPEWVGLDAPNARPTKAQHSASKSTTTPERVGRSRRASASAHSALGDEALGGSEPPLGEDWRLGLPLPAPHQRPSKAAEEGQGHRDRSDDE